MIIQIGELLQEFLVMTDNDELEILLISRSHLHDSAKYRACYVTSFITISHLRCETNTYLVSVSAKLLAFSSSRLVVGSSKASIPQSLQNVSAKASRIIIDANT